MKMKQYFFVSPLKECNKEKLMQQLQASGFTYIMPCDDKNLIYAYDPEHPPKPPKRHNKPGQGRHKKKLLKNDGSEYTCGDVLSLCQCLTHYDKVAATLGISETTFYARRKSHRKANEYYKGSTVPF